MIDNTRIHRPLPSTVNLGSIQKSSTRSGPASEEVKDPTRTSFRPTQIGPEANTFLGIIEFTDQGMLREPKQFFDVSGYIIERPKKRPLILVIFVHGWNHNASPNDTNLLEFRTILRNIRDTDKPSGDILGIYLAWPGNVRMPFPQLSYYSRLSAAERVGRVTCTEVMLSLIAHAKTAGTGKQSAARPNVKTIVIGHSMGGLVVERAFLQAMIGYAITNAPTADQVKSLSTAQQAAHDKYVDDEKAAEDMLDHEIDRWVLASKAEEKADIAFSGFRTESTKRSEKWKSSRDDLKETNGMLEKAKSRAETLQRELFALSKGESMSNVEQNAVKALADRLHHGNEGSFESVHHVLDGLVAWALEPDKSRGDPDKSGRNRFRNSVETYLDAIRTRDKNVIALVPELRKTWNDFGNQFKDRVEMAWLRSKLETFLSAAPTPSNVDEPDEPTLEFVVGTFEKKWTDYTNARQSSADWDQAEKFTQLQDAWKEALRDRLEVESAIDEANVTIELSREAQHEVAKLEKKLDIVRERPPADLVLLINPASEATLAQQMLDVWGKDRGGDLLRKMWRRGNQPWMIWISSDFDSATRKLFPFAMKASRFFRGAARSPEDILMTHTAPHLREMWTHKVIEDKDRNLKLTDARADPKTPLTPLWIVNANKRAVPNHTEIFTRDFADLVKLLLKESEVLSRANTADN